ncbi:glycosyltransferase [Corynebacterium lizhenjunii]|uniref:Glycosyltransferase n=1 Tax=Corynebacterium lizhenjunii TaxID=2709394 RepID=A0A7T0KD58_9CORY|nr:glycosyltransferase [Corynebacterium lizhenjunii]QPK78590.1 glycosyltransferase [Corynebacterium lizhenjunii]
MIEIDSILQQIDSAIDNLSKATARPVATRKTRKPGISVIIPSYRAVDTIRDTVASLVQQSLDPEFFEVIIVLNGPDDGTHQVIVDEVGNVERLNIRVFESDVASAGHARNFGLRLARHEYITFVDADDFVGPQFLAEAFANASPSVVALSPIFNVDNGEIDRHTTLAERISALGTDAVPVGELPWALGFNACKLVHHSLIEGRYYDEDLRSGEDLVYFAGLLAHAHVKVQATEICDETAYFRRLTEASVSRQPESFSFNVLERMACMQALEHLSVAPNNKTAQGQLISAQCGFISRYLENHPEATDRLEEEVARRHYFDFPWNQINRNKATGLAISYCFAPFADTSATVAGKAIAERQIVVDLISNDISKVRSMDPSLKVLSSRWIDRHRMVTAPPSFSGWKPICDFAQQALLEAERNMSEGRDYTTLYTRAVWIGSHVAGVLYKDRNRSVTWSAEFSDPLRFGVDGKPRPGELESNDIANILRRIVRTSPFGEMKVTTLFDLTEYATFALADELIFTNENQREFMLQDYPEHLREIVTAKSRVRPHPSPSAAAYQAVESRFQPVEGKVNLAYFGSFYENRGLQEIFAAATNLGHRYRSRLIFHVFCNKVDDARTEVARMGLSDVVSVRPYLPYMEFLNASTLLDVLVVNDIQRAEDFAINPFLPSKLSDYRGSGAKIWGLVDEGSPLSMQELDYRSPVGNQAAALKILEQAVVDRFGDAPSEAGGVSF